MVFHQMPDRGSTLDFEFQELVLLVSVSRVDGGFVLSPYSANLG